ncbi:MAG: hypothetical protein ACRDT4_02985 [Micromonosporaceae bacterium]
MSLVRVTDALEQCRRHIEAAGVPDPQIEAILTAYVSAVAYAGFEAEVRSIVSLRAHSARQDDREIAFGQYAAVRLVRSIRVSDLTGLAAAFHPDCRDAFRARLNPEEQSAWDSIINNRHGLAHEERDPSSRISNLTFAELEDLYPRALNVLDVFRQALFS